MIAKISRIFIKHCFFLSYLFFLFHGKPFSKKITISKIDLTMRFYFFNKDSFFFKFFYAFGTAKVMIIPFNIATNGVRFLNKCFTIGVFYHLSSCVIFTWLLIRLKKERKNKVQNNKKEQNVKNYSHRFNINIDVKLNKSRQVNCSLNNTL